MKLSIGIVGLPNVGKSTLFKLLTKQNITIANYPFATIDPNVGVVPVPDERVEKLAELSHSKKKVPAVVEFYDIAGLVKGANKGEGLGNQFLAHIRECKAIVQVVRCFPDPSVIHVDASVDPIRDLETIKTELAFKDVETVDKRLTSIESEVRSGAKGAKENKDILESVKKALLANQYLTAYAHEPVVQELQLLTAKKQVVLLNGSEADVTEGLRDYIKALGADFITMDLSRENSVAPLIRKSYEVLDLISFLTTGEDETRAWTIQRGWKAPQAAGTIHTDFEHNFIRAEVVAYEKLVEAGGWNQAKQKGWLRVEGKDYVMQDGDVVVVRHG